MLLTVDRLSAGYGSLQVVRSAELEVAAGEFVALVGRSGAGKTTLLKAVAGLLRPISGNIFFAGENITTLPANLRAQKGIALVPEGRRLFAGMTVQENLLVGAHTIESRAVIERQLARVFELFPILAERGQQVVGTLSGGEQQMCAIGRAMMSSPRLMLIDELSLGLAPSVVDYVTEALGKLRRSGATIILVEQNADVAIKMSDRIYTMQTGGITHQVKTTAVLEDPRIGLDVVGWQPDKAGAGPSTDSHAAGSLLKVTGLSKYYGRLAAVSDISFSVDAGEIVGLIGPNGAGKTTLIGLLSGAIRASQGDIRFNGQHIGGLRPHQIGGLGVIRTFQLVQPFTNLTVRECTMLGALFGRSKERSSSVAAARARAHSVLEFVGLADKADVVSEQLNVPERKRLELARAIAARPDLLLLDEVMAGLSSDEVKEVIELVRAINKKGVSIILVEHVIDSVKALCGRIMVLHHGEKIADGSPADIVKNALVKEYLGARWASAGFGPQA
jgi:ABC-type branched-subunit amino acid transport system ATPase component